MRSKFGNKSLFSLIMLMVTALLVCCSGQGCDDLSNADQPKAASGVRKATAQVETNSSGHTVEQENVVNRLKMDNKVGAIKHLYIISAYSGQVMLYSTVKGKVTSSGKRLTPKTVWAGGLSEYSYEKGITVDIGGTNYQTTEVLQDDGTYGDSMEYLYWWDSQGKYHQQYISGGVTVHISDQPIAVRSVIINLETNAVGQ